MSKRFWAGLMLFGVFLTLFSGAFLMVNLQEKATKEMALLPRETDGVQRGSPQDLIENDAGEELMVRKVGVGGDSDTGVMPGKKEDLEEDTMASEPEEIEEDGEAEAFAPAGQKQVRNILFTIHNSAAKQVYLVGEFNEWYRQPMKKQGGKWSLAVKVEPGAYGYMFIVDDRRINDPNNGKKTSEGHSLLNVKPLAR